MKSVLALALALPLAVAAVIPTAPKSSAAIAEAASNFLSSLNDEQRSAATLPFAGEQRRDWHYIPRDNEGLIFKELTDAQRTLAHALIRSSMSTAGYHKTTTIMFLDQVLYDLETARRGRPATVRDPNRYWVAVFGTPSTDENWGWRIQGHHVSMNFSAMANEITIASPAFFGANPHQILSGPFAGLRALGAEEDLAKELLGMLSQGQRGRAVLGAEVPSDIILAPGRQADLLSEPKGLPFSAMNADQQGVLWELIEEYARNARKDLADSQLARVDAAGRENIHFGWIGSVQPGEGHYYRIRGPTFVIEYDNASGNHSHTVWRDLEKDFGVDLLLKHYEQNPMPHEHR